MSFEDRRHNETTYVAWSASDLLTKGLQTWNNCSVDLHHWIASGRVGGCIEYAVCKPWTALNSDLRNNRVGAKMIVRQDLVKIIMK